MGRERDKGQKMKKIRNEKKDRKGEMRRIHGKIKKKLALFYHCLDQELNPLSSFHQRGLGK